MNTTLLPLNRKLSGHRIPTALPEMVRRAVIAARRGWEIFRQHRLDMASMRELRGMTDHQLRDIGIFDRAAIPQIVHGLRDPRINGG